jgi:hypothetical protein
MAATTARAVGWAQQALRANSIHENVDALLEPEKAEENDDESNRNHICQTMQYCNILPDFSLLLTRLCRHHPHFNSSISKQ